MAKILLLEDTCSFIPNPSAIRSITESREKGTLKYPVEIEGRLSAIGVRNENNRRYSASVWQKQLQEGSQLRTLIQHRRSVGLLEHPQDGTVSLQSPICSVLMDVRMEGNDIVGKIGFINTAEGNKMISLIEAGYNPLVSSRGYGSVAKASDGVDDVQEDYVCEGWDVVWNPSFKTAEMDGSKIRRESAAKLSETIVETTPVKANKTTSESPEANLFESKSVESYTTMHEKFKVIKESLTPLETADVSKLAPRSLVESLARCGELHRQVAIVGSTEPTLSWDVHQIHNQISAQEARITEAMAIPQKQLTTLTEQSVKTLKTLKVVAEHAVKFKAAAGKYLKEAEAKSAKLKETVERGQGWVKRAKLAEAKVDLLDRKYQFACESVDEIKLRYEADVTELGRRVLQLEFKDKFSDEALLKQLNEATSLKQLVSLRETITGVKIAEFKEPDGAVTPIKGGNITNTNKGPGVRFGKEKPDKSPGSGNAVNATLGDKNDERDEEGHNLTKDGGKAKSLDDVTDKMEAVGDKAGPGVISGKEKPDKSPGSGNAVNATLGDKNDERDEEGHNLKADGGKAKSKDDATDKEESAPSLRSMAPLTEAVLITGDRKFDVTEMAGSIRRLSESRK